MHHVSIPTLKPIKALIIYEQQNHVPFIQHHNISYSGNIDSEGSPITQSAMRELLATFYDDFKQQMTGGESVLDSRLLVHNASKQLMAWWEPAQQRKKFYKKNGKQKTLDVGWPPLVFIVTKDDLYCFALKRNERPTADTELMYAPLWNFYDNHSMCQGTARYPSTIEPNTINEWNDAVYNSAFTHSNGCHPRVKKGQDKVMDVWEKAAATKSKKFPISQLITTNITLQEAIDEQA